MANKQYDAIFVGNSLVAFSAAALLAKQGRSVLLLDPPLPSTSAPDPSFHFSEGPLFYFGYEHGGSIEGFFSRLAYPIPSLKQKGLLYQKISPLLQIIQSSHRSNLYTDQESYFEELKREFPDQTHKLKNLFNQIDRDAALYYPFLGQFRQLEIAGVGERLSEWRRQLDFSQAVRAQQKISAVDYLSQYSLSAELREYFNLLALFSSQKPLTQFSVFDLVLLLSSFKKGGARILGGYRTIVAFFQNLIEGFGGTIERGKSITKVTKQERNISEITLSNGKTFCSNQYILSQVSETSTLCFYFTIQNNLLPGPMKESLLLTWLGQCPSYLEDILVLRLNLLKENEKRQTEIRKISVSVFLKNSPVLSKSDRKNLVNSIVERLNALIPFSESKIKSLPSSKPQKHGGDPIFSLFKKEGGITGKRREFIKGAAPYYQDKEKKNLTILESDYGNMIGWSSHFIVGARLADKIDHSK